VSFVSSTSRPAPLTPVACSVDSAGCSFGGKRSEREFDHLPASGAEVKIEWSITSLHYMPSWCM
jgi:hypothetical protein